jgi:hypothetical protein
MNPTLFRFRLLAKPKNRRVECLILRSSEVLWELETEAYEENPVTFVRAARKPAPPSTKPQEPLECGGSAAAFDTRPATLNHPAPQARHEF